jgi:succinate dehydrogenase/fumarate reductase flavoprotein subunit
MSTETVQTDVLVVGGGGAAFRAAIGAREKGSRTLLVSKGPLARCGATPMAGADFTLDGLSLSRMGFLGEPKDSPETFFSDIVHQGFYLNNQKLLEQYVSSAPARLKELIDWGIKIRRSEQRAIYTTGIEIIDALHRRAKAMAVDMLEDVMILDLVIRDDQIGGALGLDLKSGQFLRFDTRTVVIATGGWHKAFWPNAGMRDLSGDGIAIASRAGAETGNMEFITFCNNILLWPPMWSGSLAGYILSFMGGELTNHHGEAFLQKYDPFVVEKGTTMEWNKGFVSYATADEVRAGRGSPHGGVYYGLGKTPWPSFEERALAYFPNWKYKALDLSVLGRKLKDGEKVEVGAVAEYFDGGIVVNERFETSLAGLYAAGECALGPFGANRVCSAITEMLVQGADAGWNAASFASRSKGLQPDQRLFKDFEGRREIPLRKETGVKPARLRRTLQERAHAHLGPVRNEVELTSFIQFLEGLKATELPQLATGSKSRIYNKEWFDALELPNMVHLLEGAARSALLRTESRGVHFRVDYPHTDNDRWLCESVVTFVDGRFHISTRSPVFTSITPPGGVTPYLAMWKKMMEAHSPVGGGH